MKKEEWVRGRESDPRLSLTFAHSRQRLACGLRPAAAAAVVCPLTLWNKGYKVTNGIAFVTTVPFWGGSEGCCC